MRIRRHLDDKHDNILHTVRRFRQHEYRARERYSPIVENLSRISLIEEASGSGF